MLSYSICNFFSCTSQSCSNAIDSKYCMVTFLRHTGPFFETYGATWARIVLSMSLAHNSLRTNFKLNVSGKSNALVHFSSNWASRDLGAEFFKTWNKVENQENNSFIFRDFQRKLAKQHSFKMQKKTDFG